MDAMIKYNVGCGKRNFGADWFHVDGADFPHVWGKDVFLRGTPSNMVDLLYSSHLIAYFDREEVEGLFKEWFRVLKPGGRIEVATPDFTTISRLYSKGVLEDDLLGPMYGKMKMGNETIYHKTLYGFIGLRELLRQAGFTDIKLYDHTKTCHPNTGNREDKYDDCSASYLHGELISLNVTAIKPPTP